MKLYITRHGETKWNKIGKLQGQMNSGLTKTGRLQATWLADRLNDTQIDVICSSTSGRAVQTAEILKKERAIEIQEYEDLREINLGSWQGMMHDQIMTKFPGMYNNLWNHPEKFEMQGMETVEALTVRAGRIFEQIIEEHEGKDVLIVAHALLIKGMLSYVKRLDVKEFWTGPFMNSTCLTVIDVESSQRNIELEGDTSHIKK